MSPLAFGRSDPHLREVVRGAASAFVAKLLGAGLTLAFSVLLTRLAGADQAGLFFLLLNLVTLAAIVGRVGLDNTVVRFVAGHAAAGEPGAVRRVYRIALALTLAGSLCVALLLYGAAPVLAEGVFGKPDLLPPLRWGALAVVPLALTVLHAQALRGLKRVFWSSVLEPQGLVVALGGIGGLLLLTGPVSASGVTLAYLAGTAGAAALGGLVWWRFLRGTPSVPGGEVGYRRVLASSLPLLSAALMSYLITWSGSLFLGVWGTTEDLSVFNVASRAALLVSFVLFAVNSIVAPKFAGLYRKGDLEGLERTARHSMTLTTLAALPPLLLFGLFPGWVMGWFGPGFEAHGAVLVILAAGQFVNVLTGSVGHLLMMCGQESLLRNNIAFGTVLNVVLSLLLVPPLGALGAAIAAAVALAVKNLVAFRLVRTRLGVRLYRPVVAVPFGPGRGQGPTAGGQPR